MQACIKQELTELSIARCHFKTQTKTRKEEASARERRATIGSMRRIHEFGGFAEDNSLLLLSRVPCPCFEKPMGNALSFQHFPVLPLTEQWQQLAVLPTTHQQGNNYLISLLQKEQMVKVVLPQESSKTHHWKNYAVVIFLDS